MQARLTTAAVQGKASTLPGLRVVSVFVEGTVLTALSYAEPATLHFQARGAAIETSTTVDIRKVQAIVPDFGHLSQRSRRNARGL